MAAPASSYDVLVQIQADISNMANNMNRAGSSISNLGNQAKSTGSIISTALSFAGGLGIINVLSQVGDKFMEAAKMGWNFNSSMQQNLASFKTMLNGSDEAAKQMVDTLTAMAASTPFETTDLTKAATTLMGFGVEASKVQKTLQMLGDASQGNKGKFDSLTLAFAQVQSAGKLTGQDLLQMVNAGFNPLNVMAKETGMSMAELKKKMSDGAISAKAVEIAFEAATSKGGLFYGAMEAQSKTFEGQMSTLRDNLSLTFGQIMKPLFEDVSNNILPKITEKLSVFQKAFEKTSSIITAISEVINSFRTAVSGSDSSLSRMQPQLTFFQKIMNDISSTVMPAAQKIFDTFTNRVLPDFREGFNSYVQKVYPVFKEAIEFMVNRILPNMVKYYEFIYTEILPEMSKAFKEIMPRIGQMVKNMWDVMKPILEQLVKQFEVSWPYIKQLIKITVEAIGLMVVRLFDIFLGVTEFLSGIFTKDWQKAWDGLIKIFKGTFIETLLNYVKDVTQIGVNIVIGLVNGINSMETWVKTKVTEFVSGIGKTMKEFFGIASPSKVTTEFGKRIAEGLGIGIEQDSKKAESAAKKMAKQVSDEIQYAMDKANKFAKDLMDTTMSSLNRLGDATSTALRNKWSKEEQMQLDSLTKQSDMLKTQTDLNIAQYDRELLAKLKLLDDGTSEEVKALQKKIDALDKVTKAEEKSRKEQEDSDRIKSKLGEIGKEADPTKKLQLQKELEDLLATQNRENILEIRENEKAALREEMENIRIKSEEKRKKMIEETNNKKLNEQNMRDFTLSSLDEQAKAIKLHYENLMKEENVQAVARYLALEKNNNELIELLKTYNPKWQDAGQSFGEKIIEGINSTKTGIQAAVASALALVDQLKSAQSIVIQNAQRAWNEAKARGDQKGMDEAHQAAEDARNSMPAYANGTDFHPGGQALVGEFGPEVVNLPRGSQVTPNGKFGNINITIGTLVGSNGIEELGNILSRKLNKKYSAAIGGGNY